ncbi:MAG TPA: cellulase family glycosylhydrolase [Rhizomicrobium sp.]|nr:cellulase family glycosylhydrolase [Rhizomicrobium sp.]
MVAMLCAMARPAQSQIVRPQTYGVGVQVSNGKAVPSVQQLTTVLHPGDFVRDVLGWQKADVYCDLLEKESHGIRIPAAMASLYQNVAAAGGKNFVALGFSNIHCGQISSSGMRAFPDTPALRAEFAAYAVGVVRNVPALGALSLWNELNGSFNGGIAGKAQKLTRYCLLANEVIGAVRHVNPDIPIAIGASQGWDIDGWFSDLFDKYGCVGKGDPTIWLDVHPYLTGNLVAGTGKNDIQLWQDAVANIRQDGISNPLFASEWGAWAAHKWSLKHRKGDYLDMFKSQIFGRDPNWAGGTWFELLHDARVPNAGLFDKYGALTPLGALYIGDFTARHELSIQ